MSTLALLLGQIVVLDAYDLALRAVLLRSQRKKGTDDRLSLPGIARPFTPYQARIHVAPWAIVASVHEIEADLDGFLEAQAPYRDKLVVIDDASTDRTYERLAAAGVKVLRGGTNRKKPGAIRELLDQLDPQIETIVVIDPDVALHPVAPWPRGAEMEQVLFDFQRSGAEAAVPRVAIVGSGLLSDLQALEYWFAATLGRRLLGDGCVTSGVAIYKREALEAALSRHALSVYAEDLRNALLILGAGGRIYYDGRLVGDTTGKTTWKGWFSQRVGWYFGLIRVYAESLADVRKCAARGPLAAYHYAVYTGLLGILLQPLRILSVGLLLLSFAGGLDGLLGLGLLAGNPRADSSLVLTAWLQYTVLSLLALFLAVPRGERKGLLLAAPVYFPYVLLHVIPVSLGFANYLTLRYFGRRLYRDHYQDEESLRREVYVRAAA